MNALKLIFSLFVVLFISSSLFAFSTDNSSVNTESDSVMVDNNKTSVVSAVSLFSLISLTEESKDSVNKDNSRIVQFMDLIQTYL